MLIDAETGRRVDAVEGRTAVVAEKWLSDHPGAEVVCRDGSGAYGEAVRQALPCAVQVSDRWHLWHLLAEAVRKEVAAHCACWAKGMPLQDGQRAATTAERWQQVHQLRSQNVGLFECGRRLGLSMNTVKRYDRASEPQWLQRVPKYRPTLVDPYRDYLRKRRAEDPAVQPAQLLREIRELGYPGSMNLLVRYINQGRLDNDRPHLSARRAARILLTRPDRLTGGQAETRARLEAACPEMTALTSLISSFAQMLAPSRENEAGLQQWITRAREADLPHLHSFTRGLDLDTQAVMAALTLPFHNGHTEGVNTIKDQNDQKTDVRTRRLHPPPPPDTPRLTPRTVTTEYATEPLTTQALAAWAAANNVEIAHRPTNSSWLNRIEAQSTALRYFTLDGTDHASHQEQASMIRRYIIWRNNHAYDERLRRIVAKANVA